VLPQFVNLLLSPDIHVSPVALKRTAAAAVAAMFKKQCCR
jgi:hypothetical protein